jgi:sugar O-acyltransferase (sialic acid O-acetyltransferase NeuD family)
MPATGSYRRYGKRLLDLSIAIPLCLVLLPAMFGLALLVRVKLGRPVFFRQRRPGFRARPLAMLKFRTMTDARDDRGQLLPDDQRLPPFGRWLRSTSLDELPELWHVVRGEMSLVGPRPLLTCYLDRYTPAEARRHDVRPGITGWAQINGRNAVDWDTRLALDAWYVDHLSLRLDLQILLRTIGAVLRRADISQPGQATVLPLRPHLARTAAAEFPGGAGDVVVLGAGGHAKVVVATLEAAGHRVAAVLDDDPRLWGTTVLGTPVSGPIDTIARCGRCRAIVAVGDNAVRRRIAQRMPRVEWVTVVHPAATVHPSVVLGPGTVVCAGAVIQPEARVGAHAIVNTSASVDHDSVLGDFVHTAPGARLAGQVTVGAGTLVGIGASALPGVSIGAESVVGAGSVVVRDLPDHVVAVGAPARITRIAGFDSKAA